MHLLPRRVRPRVVGCPAYLLAAVAALGPLAGASHASAAATAYGWPVPAPHPVLRGYEAPVSEWGPGHRGADLAARGGTVVVAAGAGTVTFAAVLAGRGVVVVAHPGGLRTTYEPVVASVRVGARVARGDPLGRLALPGSHCLPRACLHWGALRGSAYLDPLTLLGLASGPIRLLPLGPGGDAATDPGGDTAPALLPLSAGVATIQPARAVDAVVPPAPRTAATPRRRSSVPLAPTLVGSALGVTTVLGAVTVRVARRSTPPMRT